MLVASQWIWQMGISTLHDQAVKPLMLFPHELEFASPWATIPGHSGSRHPGISAWVAVGSAVAMHRTLVVRAAQGLSYTALSISA